MFLYKTIRTKHVQHIMRSDIPAFGNFSLLFTKEGKVEMLMVAESSQLIFYT